MSRNSWKGYSLKGLAFGKKGLDKAWNTIDKLGAPVNRMSNRLGAEAFWPTTLDKESEKAARILRSFCKDGFYNDVDAGEVKPEEADQNQKIDKPRGKQRVLAKIPSEVIKQAKGLAICTTMRAGLWLSGSGGSGVLLARIPETGEWSPPSGIMLHTAALGFLAGVDIYDCVIVINTYEALEGFKGVRATLGGKLSVSAGPVGVGGVMDTEVHKRQAPIWAYLKSRGLYAGISVDGTIVSERSDENERFYGKKVGAHDILTGKVQHPPESVRVLLETVKAAQGDKDVDESLLPAAGEEVPGDAVVASPHSRDSFGIPSVDDPDPYGVRALEEQGLFIREAGTHSRPSSDAFEFRPAPTSPLYHVFAKKSQESSPQASWRGSVQSIKSYTSVDRGTQTDDMAPYAPSLMSDASTRSTRDVATSPPDESLLSTPDTSQPDTSHGHHDMEADFEQENFEIHDASNATITKTEVVHNGASTTQEDKSPPANFSRPRLVTIPKRVPPALPPRNPNGKHDSISTQDSIALMSPSPTSSTHPVIRASLDSERSVSMPELMEEGSEEKAYLSVTEEFHSSPSSPILEGQSSVRPATSSQTA
ncbi:hypothetical protein VTN31DRAFT_7225 [Thermomyces dupontii]|uniref:uncharacterized protein n=1 Tax=Talaromyces thermophilus TaxID=28565 RepID=UPI00374446E1